MFGLCCAKASSLHYCNFICVCSLQNVMKPKINSLRCFVFGSLKNMIELAINSSKYFVFGFLQNTTYHAILVCCFQNMIKPAMISYKFYVFVFHP
jgi:hypothetical protein